MTSIRLKLVHSTFQRGCIMDNGHNRYLHSNYQVLLIQIADDFILFLSVFKHEPDFFGPKIIDFAICEFRGNNG